MVQLVVGRTEEVGALGGLLADPLAQPRALLIEGEPGIGKTTLLRQLIAIAQERGYAILSCRPTRSEMDLSYVGLVELLAAVDDGVVDALPAPQARVLRMILRREEPDGAFDRLSLGVAMVAAVHAIAAARPVLVAVDDAQWLDHPTAHTLAFVLRRLSAANVRIAFVRTSAPIGRGFDRLATTDDVLDWPDELARAMPPGRLETIRLGPLGPSELSRILRRVLGWVPAWPRVVRIAELTDGNPLYALELTRAVGASRSGGDLDGPLPEGVAELARSRVANLPPRVREVVELASIPRVPRLDMLRRLDPSALDLRDAVAAAAHSGIVTFDGDSVHFAHPILAAAAYGSIPAARRRELHRAVAMLSDELEERARHLATAAEGPDPQAALVLESAAEQAWRRGAPDAAANLLRSACRLTPPADSELLALRRIAYGRLLYSAGDGPAALTELGQVVADQPRGPIRARALYHLMYVTRLSGSLGPAVAYGLSAAEDAAADPSLQAEVFELLSRLSDDDIGRKLEIARRGIEAIERLADPDPEVVFYVRAALVEAEFYAGLGIHLDRLEGLDPGPGRRFPPVRTALGGDDLIGRLLTYSGRIDEGLEILRGMYERASVASRSILPAILGWMAEAELMAGRFGAAYALTTQAIERSEETGGRGGTPWEVGFHGVALALLGRLDEAEAAAAPVLSSPAGETPDSWPARLALGLVYLARGTFAEAADQLRRLDEAKRSAGLAEPRLCHHASDLIDALIAVGDLAEAEAVATRLDEEAVSSDSPWSLAAASRGLALIEAAHGRLDAALAAAQQSLSLLEGLPMPFERARTTFAIGQIHRRRREKRLAREALTQARRWFDEHDAPIWADRARAELDRIPHQRVSADLTPTEETIARLAGQGLTNREIADRTFLSPKTVEVNLTRIYRKLGVRSRAGLAGRLAGDAPHG